MVFGSLRKPSDSTANTALNVTPGEEVPTEGAPSTKAAFIRVAATGAGLVCPYVVNGTAAEAD